ncbi:MAG: TonB-dependent receptor [Pseudomonadota bacterium]
MTLSGVAQEPDMLVQDTVVVEGSRSNPMLANVEPEVALDFAEIRSYGAESLQDLLADLAPLTNSNRGGGAPAILLNGRRVSGFREIRNYPPEALARVEILPEAVALKFGFRADQKVINFVLRNRFHALTGAASLAAPTAGGQAVVDTDLSNLRIRDERRWNLDLNVEHQDELLESDRDIITTAAGAADRSLQPEQTTVGLTGSYSHFLPGDIAATYTLGLDASDQQRAIAQTGTTDTLARDTDTLGANASFVLNKVYNDWNWSVNGRIARQETDSLTDPALITGLSETTDSKSDEAALEAVGFFKIAPLPAGDLVTTLKAGADTEAFSSTSSLSGAMMTTDLSRDSLNAQINLDAPLLDRDMAGNPIGTISLNANARIDDVSDAGSLSTYGMGVTWQPTSTLQIIASTAQAEDAPSLQELGNPLSSVDNARVFDFLAGTTVEGVVRLSGGNPALRPETRTVHDLNLSWDPFETHDVTFNLAYTETEIEDAILAFPGLTPDIELAFPERVLRATDGTLLQLDARPINIAESTKRELSYGLNWSIRLPRPDRPDLEPEERRQLRDIFFQRLDEEDRARIEQRIAERAARQASAGDRRPQGAGAGRSGRPRGRGGRGGFGSGRLFVSLNHTAILEDELRIGPGTQPLDLLNGDAISDRGGTSEHLVTAQAGASHGALGGFMRVRWQSSTTFNDGTGTALRFGELTTTSLRLQYNFERNTKLLLKYPFLSSTRLSFGVDNLFDEKQEVTDATGAVPIIYQPDLIDPRGRTLSLRLRKLFY